MGQARRRGTYEQRVKQAPKKRAPKYVKRWVIKAITDFYNRTHNGRSNRSLVWGERRVRETA